MKAASSVALDRPPSGARKFGSPRGGSPRRARTFSMPAAAKRSRISINPSRVSPTQLRCAIASSPCACLMRVAISTVPSRVAPPAPYVTETKEGSSGFRASTVSNSSLTFSGVFGGKNSIEKTGSGPPRISSIRMVRDGRDDETFITAHASAATKLPLRAAWRSDRRGLPSIASRPYTGLGGAREMFQSRSSSIASMVATDIECRPIASSDGLVPMDEYRQIVLVAERAQCSGPEPQESPVRRRQVHPPRADHAQHVTVAEEDHVAARLPGLGDQPICSRAHVGGGLAIGAAVTPQNPVRIALMDLRRGDSLVFPVVPFVQVVADLRRIAQPRQLARLDRPLHRARQDQGEGPAVEPPREIASA